MPLRKTCSVKAFKDNIRQLIKKEGYDQDVAVAIAFETLRRACGAPVRAKEERWTPEDIVAYKKGESIENFDGQEVMEQILEDMNEDELKILCDGLQKLEKMSEEELRKAGLDEEIGPYKILGPTLKAQEEKKEEEKEEELEFEEEALTKEDFANIRQQLARGIVLAFAEILKDYDIDRITTDDVNELISIFRDESRRIALRLPMLARTELRRLKSMGTDRFIRWMRQQLLQQ